MKKMTILFTSFPDFSGNSKSLFMYMNNRYKENMDLIWVIENEEVLSNLKNEGIKAVKWYSEEYLELLNNANVLFDTHGQFSNVNNNDKIYINLWHGMPIKKIGYLLEDENLNDIDIAFLDGVSSNTDFIFVTSPFYSSIISSVFNINVKKVLPLGMPRLDDLFTPKNKKKFDNLINCKTSDFNKILIYLPTYRNGCGKTNDGQLSNENILNLKKYNEESLIKYLEKIVTYF